MLKFCSAGNLARGLTESSHWSSQCSEFLAINGVISITPAPGTTSFTSALIWGLGELLKENSEGCNTSESQRKIIKAPNFPMRQISTRYQEDALL